jgi:hypothetical protein
VAIMRFGLLQQVGPTEGDLRAAGQRVRGRLSGQPWDELSQRCGAAESGRPGVGREWTPRGAAKRVGAVFDGSAQQCCGCQQLEIM